MTEMNGEMTLAEVVNSNPAAAGVLEGLGLDYCCGGARTLASAASAAGLDLADVEAAIAAAATRTDDDSWVTMAPAELVEHIESVHHTYLHDELARLTALVEKVHTVHGERHPELSKIRELFLALRADLDPHLQKEEQVLFPMIRELSSASDVPEFHCGSLRNPITVMQFEHESAGELLASLRIATNGYQPPADGCGSYQALFSGLAAMEADTHLHIHKENNILFPAVIEMEQRVAEASI